MIETKINFQYSIANEFRPGYFDLATPKAIVGPLSPDFSVEVEFKLWSGNTWSKINWPTKSGEKIQIKYNWGKVCPAGCTYVKHAEANIEDAYLIFEGE